MLAFNTSQCREVKEWFSFYGNRFDAPVMGIHTPTNIDEITPGLVDYLAEAWRELILELESHSGHSFDKARFEETLALSHEACQLWQRFLDTCQRKPAQHTFFDHVFLMAPVVVLRGTQEAVDFYKQLLAEVESLRGCSSDRAVPAVLGRDADLGQAALPGRDLQRAPRQRRGFDLLPLLGV